MDHPEDARAVRERPDDERDELARQIASRLDAPMTALGILFGLLVLAETLVSPEGALGTAFTVTSWAIFAVFVAEFLLRLYVAPSRTRFLRRNWWQVIFLVLPFLRVLRVLRGLRWLRIGRTGRILSSALRVTRTAGRRLRGRIAWLATTTSIVVLASSQLLYEFGDVPTYVEALYRATMATVTGEPTTVGGVGRILDVVLASYSVVVFAALAASIGAYLVEQRSERGPVAGASAVDDDAVPA